MEKNIESTTSTTSTTASVEYTCPMHPEVVSSQPGRCPTCNMHLEVKAAKSATSAKGGCCGLHAPV